MPKSSTNTRNPNQQIIFRGSVDQVVGALVKGDNTELAKTVVEFLTMSGDLTTAEEKAVIQEFDLED